MYHRVRIALGESIDRYFLLLGDFERVEMSAGRLNQRLGFKRSIACNQFVCLFNCLFD